MSSVWVVVENYWNGEWDAARTHSVYATEEGARAFVEERNAARTSSYQSSYDYEEFTVTG